MEAWVSSGQSQGQGYWQEQSWEAWHVAYGLLEEVANSPTMEPPGGQPTNWRTITKEVLTLMQKSQPL